MIKNIYPLFSDSIKIGEVAHVQFSGVVEDIIKPDEFDAPGKEIVKLRTPDGEVLYTLRHLITSKN